MSNHQVNLYGLAPFFQHFQPEMRLPLEEHLCPICGTSMVSNPRYPRAVCADCVNSAADQSGRAIKFYNTDLSGGLTGRYTDGTLYDSADCWINGIACRASEAYMGGVVIEVLAV